MKNIYTYMHKTISSSLQGSPKGVLRWRCYIVKLLCSIIKFKRVDLHDGHWFIHRFIMTVNAWKIVFAVDYVLGLRFAPSFKIFLRRSQLWCILMYKLNSIKCIILLIPLCNILLFLLRRLPALGNCARCCDMIL